MANVDLFKRQMKSPRRVVYKPREELILILSKGARYVK